MYTEMDDMALRARDVALRAREVALRSRAASSIAYADLLERHAVRVARDARDIRSAKAAARAWSDAEDIRRMLRRP